MGLNLQLRKFTNSFYIPLLLNIKDQLEWDEKTELDMEILPVVDKDGNIVSKMLTITEKNIAERIEHKIHKLKTKNGE